MKRLFVNFLFQAMAFEDVMDDTTLSCYRLEHKHKNGVKLVGKPFKYRETVYNEVNILRFNIFKSREEFDDPITFDVLNIDGKYSELDINNSNMKAYFPMYVEDGKSFSGIS